jgi:hypothetical protein
LRKVGREMPQRRLQKSRFNLTVGVCGGSTGAAAGAELVGVVQPLPRRSTRTPTMTKDQKIIRAKVGVLELAKVRPRSG